MFSRRDFGRLALAGVPLSVAFGAKVDSTAGGVRIGATTFSFRELPRTPGQDNVNEVIQGLQFAGVGDIELNSVDTEAPAPDSRLPPPQGPSVYGGPVHEVSAEDLAAAKRIVREGFRKWRLYTPDAYYTGIRAKFDAAGISLYAYTMNYDDQFTDAEIEGTFRQAKALGVGVIATSTTLAMARRLAPIADKHLVTVALRNLTEALPLSNNFRVSLDIAAHSDPVACLKENHDRITHILVKDRTKATGANEKFGDGDTPIKPVLTLLKEKKYPIRAFVEYEYFGLGTAAEEVRKCMLYVRSVLS